TTPDADAALLDAIAAFPAPVVIAVAGAEHGLTQRQRDFQRRYVEGRRTGSATVRTTQGVVRRFYPAETVGESGGGGSIPAFVTAIGEAADIAVPATPQRIAYRPPAPGGPPAIRAFPLHRVEHLPADWFTD